MVDSLRSASAKLQAQLGHSEAAAAELKALADRIDRPPAGAAGAAGAAAGTSITGAGASAVRHRADLVLALSYVDPQLAARLAAAPEFTRAAAVDTAAVDVDAVLAGFLA